MRFGCYRVDGGRRKCGVVGCDMDLVNGGVGRYCLVVDGLVVGNGGL